MQLEEEAVELRLGQRVRALHLERVLRGEHEERLLERVASCWPTVTRCSCIASSSALCVFGVARLISSASTMFAKIGPLLELERLARRRASSSMTVVPMMSAGIRSGVNWMRENSRPSASASVRTSIVLPRPGHAFEQRVPAGEQAGEHAVDDLAVADDDLADLLAQRADLLLKLLRLLRGLLRYRS